MTCRVGQADRLACRNDATTEQVVEAILTHTNTTREATNRVESSWVDAVRGPVPLPLIVERIRTYNPNFAVCIRDGDWGGLTRVPVSASMTYATDNGADPTDPWSAFVMLVHRLRRIAEARVADYATLWDSVTGSTEATEQLRYLWMQTGLRYGNAPNVDLVEGALDEGYFAVSQGDVVRAGFVDPITGPGTFGSLFGDVRVNQPWEWPEALYNLRDFWILVLAEEQLSPSLANTMWDIATYRNLGGLTAYYTREDGTPSPAAASLAYDGILWAQSPIAVVASVLDSYSSLASDLRQKIGLTAGEAETMLHTLRTAAISVGKIGTYRSQVDFNVGTSNRSWNQTDWIPGLVHNDGERPYSAAIPTLLPWTEQTRWWAGMLHDSPVTPDGDFPAGSYTIPTTSSASSGRGPLIALLVGGVVVGGYLLWERVKS
jgi:hypothetical protein